MGAGMLQEGGEDEIELGELFQGQNVFGRETAAQLAIAGESFAGGDPFGVGLADRCLRRLYRSGGEVVGDEDGRPNDEAEQECCGLERCREEKFWESYHVITARDRN